ncbi:MAG: hypothetical protein ABI426_01800 [Flavobacterium sp.]
MLKNILNLKGAQKLTKDEQKIISGGRSQPLSLCMYPVELCSEGRVYDPCGPITATNYYC